MGQSTIVRVVEQLAVEALARDIRAHIPASPHHRVVAIYVVVVAVETMVLDGHQRWLSLEVDPVVKKEETVERAAVVMPQPARLTKNWQARPVLRVSHSMVARSLRTLRQHSPTPTPEELLVGWVAAEAVAEAGVLRAETPIHREPAEAVAEASPAEMAATQDSTGKATALAEAVTEAEAEVCSMSTSPASEATAHLEL